MISFIRRFLTRKPKPPVIGCDLYARTPNTDYKLVGRYSTKEKAHKGASVHAARECFRTGDVVFFEFKFEPVYAEPVSS